MSRKHHRAISKQDGKEMHSEQVMKHRIKLENKRSERIYALIGTFAGIGWVGLTIVCYLCR